MLDHVSAAVLGKLARLGGWESGQDTKLHGKIPKLTLLRLNWNRTVRIKMKRVKEGQRGSKRDSWR